MINFKELIKSSEYDFLTTDKRLGNNIILLGVGGSYAYGMNNEQSDIDIRGVATNSKKDILIGHDFEQVVNNVTDTTIYSFNKIVKLLCSSNPNTIEMLGLKPEHYIYLSDAGKKLLSNKDIFLSKAAIYSFGGYANAQLRRLENKSARLTEQSKLEEHILKSIEHAEIDYKQKYFPYSDNSINLYTDVSNKPEYDSEIFADINLKHYPLRDFKDMCNEMNAVVKAYGKSGARNQKAIEHNKLAKHMAHTVRLFFMCFDILEKGEIITYREKEHDLLMDIRNGKYLDENRQPTKDFYDIVDDLESRLDYDKEHTHLPDKVDMEKVSNLVAEVNEVVVYR